MALSDRLIESNIISAVGLIIELMGIGLMSDFPPPYLRAAVGISMFGCLVLGFGLGLGTAKPGKDIQ